MQQRKLSGNDFGQKLLALIFIEQRQGAFKHVENKKRHDCEMDATMRKQVRASRNAHGHHANQNKGDTVRKAKDTHHFAFQSWSYRIDLAVATQTNVGTAGRIQKGQEMHPAPFEKTSASLRGTS